MKRVTSLEEESTYLRSAYNYRSDGNNSNGAARCLVLPGALKRKPRKNFYIDWFFCGLPPGYDARGACMCAGDYYYYNCNEEISYALKALGNAHRSIAGDGCARAYCSGIGDAVSTGGRGQGAPADHCDSAPARRRAAAEPYGRD